MNKFLKALFVITIIGLVLYALYLCYEKFVKNADEDEWDDLEDWGEEEATDISFTERVKAAAERQLQKAK